MANLAVPGDMMMAGIAGGAVNGAVNAAVGGGSVFRGALMGGTIGALTGYYNSQGIVDRTTGPIWNGPNTLIGAAFLGLNEVTSVFTGTSMGFGFGDGAIQVTNAPLMGHGPGFTLGQFQFYGTHSDGSPYSPLDVINSAYTNLDVRLGGHEGSHTHTQSIFGPLFGPLYLMFGGPNSGNPFERGADFEGIGGSFWDDFNK